MLKTKNDSTVHILEVENSLDSINLIHLFTMAQTLFGVGDNQGEAVDLDFDLFTKPLHNTNFALYNDITIHPRTPLERIGNNPVTFDLGDHDYRHYIIPSSIRVHGCVKVTREKGDAITDADHIAPVSMFPHALFESIDVQINTVPITDHYRLYPYKAYIQAHFASTSAVKSKTLCNEWYERDTLDSEDSVNANAELIIRRSYIAKSKEAYFTFEPRIDSGTMSRFFPPGHVLSLEFMRSDPRFALLYIGAESFRIEMTSLYLTCRQVLPVPSIESSMRSSLAKKPIYLPMTKMVCRTRTLHAGIVDGTIRNAITGKLPNHIMVFLLSNAQMDDRYGKNPFFFSSHGLKEACLIVDGQAHPSEKLTLDKAKGDYRRLYAHFMDNIGLKTDSENGITPADYVKDSFGLAFDMTPDMCMNNHLHSTSPMSTVDIRLTFSPELPEALTVIFISTYDDIVTIHPDKSVRPSFINNST